MDCFVFLATIVYMWCGVADTKNSRHMRRPPLRARLAWNFWNVSFNQSRSNFSSAAILTPLVSQSRRPAHVFRPTTGRPSSNPYTTATIEPATTSYPSFMTSRKSTHGEYSHRGWAYYNVSFATTLVTAAEVATEALSTIPTTESTFATETSTTVSPPVSPLRCGVTKTGEVDPFNLWEPNQPIWTSTQKSMGSRGLRGGGLLALTIVGGQESDPRTICWQVRSIFIRRHTNFKK